MKETKRLLQEYCATNSEDAFQQIVARYLNLVYSVALRRLGGDSHLARDVAQTVFSDLATKAKRLPPDVQLGGWLHRHACFTASKLARADQRRRIRELESAHMNALHASESSWNDLSPEIDNALNHLNSPERDAIVLRYFEHLDLKSVGAAFGVSEDAAQKRVSRALEKLRQFLARRGVALSGAALGVMLERDAICNAPAGWSTVISSAALESASAHLGFAAAIAAWLSPVFLKWAAASLGIAFLTGALLWKSARANDPSGAETPGIASVSEQAAPEIAHTIPISAKTAIQPQTDPAAAKESPVLHLTILADDSGLPIPNVPIEIRAKNGTIASHANVAADRFGKCQISKPFTTASELELVTRVEGFSDTRLRWRADRGEQIPETYTLRLDRAVPIGGRVVDDAGRPIAGAAVEFHEREQAVESEPVASHYFGGLITTTDADGNWTVSRIAQNLLGRSDVEARHSNYALAGVNLENDARSVELLRAGKHVFTLPAFLTVRGVVVDFEGNPVSGAEVLFGMQDEVSSRSGTTGLDGSFSLEDCRPGKNLLTAQVPQFAPSTIEIDVTAEADPVKIVLSRGKPLKLRIVNRSGEPVTTAQLLLSATALEEAPAFVKRSFSTKADADGRFFWDQAPDREIAFDITAPGYMRTNEFRIVPDGQEHTVVLSPALRIRGTVADARTGEPIPQFCIVTGRPELRYFASETNQPTISPWWSSLPQDWTSSQGKFEQSFGDQLFYNETNPRFIFKFEAAGYAPFVTRIVNIDEMDATFDIRLTKTKPNPVTIILPDGRHAVAADILLARVGQHVRVGDGGLARDSGIFYLAADRDGRFDFQPEPETVRVFAANPAGFGSATPAELNATHALRLQAWARLEGCITEAGKPLEAVAIRIEPLPNTSSAGQHRLPDPFLSIPTHTLTDAQGRFRLENLPPGNFFVLGKPPGPGVSARLGDIDLQPGKLTRIAAQINSAGLIPK